MVELLQIFVDNIAPILVVALIGYVAGRRFGIEGRSTGQLIYYVFSPALIFTSLYTSEIDGGEILSLALALTAQHVAIAAISFAVLRFIKGDRLDKSAVALTVFCLNAGNYGLSLVSFAFGEAVLARAVIIFVFSMLLNYSIGVFIASSGQKSPLEALRSVLTVPALYVAVIALVLRALMGDNLPVLIMRPMQLLASAAIPSMLVMLGLQLVQSARLEKVQLISAGVALKLLVAPLLATAIALLFNLDTAARIAFIAQCSMPTAVMTLVLADQFNLDQGLTLNVILASTLASPIPLSVIVYLLQQSPI